MKTFKIGSGIALYIPKSVREQMCLERGEELMWYVHNNNELRISKIPEDYEPQIWTDAELAQEFAAIKAQEELEKQNKELRNKYESGQNNTL